MTPETRFSPDVAARDRARPVVEHVQPAVDCGRYPAKRIAGDTVLVQADAFADGHDLVTAEVRWRGPSSGTWASAPMRPLGNDRWEGSFKVAGPGLYEFAVRAGMDRFGTWVHGLTAKVDAGQEISVELLVGEQLLTTSSRRAKGPARAELRRRAARLRALALSAQRAGSREEAASPRPDRPDPTSPSGVPAEAVALVHDDSLRALAARYQDAGPWVSSDTLRVDVGRFRAGFGSWYELFPRSASPDPDRPGRLSDVVGRLPDIARLGFDVLYLPPIHPIGHTNRKGPDGTRTAAPDDPGSPWAIGSEEGGHTAVDPGLGSLADVGTLIEEAAGHGIEVALDLALQCSPDHPWVSEHPTWFRRLPDGSIAFAENPPKRYEDVYPIDFETPDWAGLWSAVLGVVRFWIGTRGSHLPSRQPPHQAPALLALADPRGPPEPPRRAVPGRGVHEATGHGASGQDRLRPVLHVLHLAQRQVGARDLPDRAHPQRGRRVSAAQPLAEHARHLARRPSSTGVGRPSCRGSCSPPRCPPITAIYGPPFELLEHEPRHEGSEEYLHSEKYEIAAVGPRPPGQPLRPHRADQRGEARRTRRCSRTGPSGSTTSTTTSSSVYSKRATAEPVLARGDQGPDDVVLAVVNLDPGRAQSGWTYLSLEALGVPEGDPFEVHDLLTGARYVWRGPWNYVRLDPGIVPAHVFHVRGGSR